VSLSTSNANLAILGLTGYGNWRSRSAIRNLLLARASNSLELSRWLHGVVEGISQSTLLRSQIAAKWSIVDFVFQEVT